NHFYQFSFEPNNEWPNYYSRQPSILEYLKHCADKYGVREHVRFRHEVERATYDEARRLWTVEAVAPSGQREILEVNALICAVGQLNRPAIPRLPGLDRFAGETMHTANWPSNACMKGRRVALIGTGASGVQVGPGIVDQVASLHVYQRSGAWVA